MWEFLAQLIKKIGRAAIPGLLLVIVGVWVLAHLLATPGERVSVLWGLVEYTKAERFDPVEDANSLFAGDSPYPKGYDTHVVGGSIKAFALDPLFKDRELRQNGSGGGQYWDVRLATGPFYRAKFFVAGPDAIGGIFYYFRDMKTAQRYRSAAIRKFGVSLPEGVSANNLAAESNRAIDIKAGESYLILKDDEYYLSIRPDSYVQ